MRHVKARSDAARSRSLTKADYETLSEFRYLMRRFAAFSEAAAREAGLTPQQHQALLAVRGFPGSARANIGDLAQRLNIRHHSVVGLVDRLVSKGLLQRQVDPVDRRRVLVALTDKSKTLLEGLSRAHREELRRVAPMLRGLLASIERGIQEL
jgi:DNA-binding MarR family transcriptional regulator